MIGQTLGHYRIEEQLGAGGMGVVYRARDTRLERTVALKMLGENLPDDESARARLLNEARSASALNHPNICTIHEIGEAEGQAYIAMEYVEGRPLSAMVPAEGLPVETVIRYGSQVADALAHAHERGVIHRDLKSANVIITSEGRAKVLDFGLARRMPTEDLTQMTQSRASLEEGPIAGTLHYLPPEVLRGEPAGAASDLWALGVLLSEMAVGKLPFQGRTGFELSSAILRETPELPPHVPAGLRAIIQRLLAKEPGHRYRQAVEVRAALETVQSVGLAFLPVPSRRRWLWPSIAAGALLAIALVIGLALQRRGPSPPAPAAGPRLSTGGRPSTNREANEYFQKAMLFMRASPDLLRAREMLEKALALDPHFAQARSFYGFTHVLMILRGLSNDSSWLYKAEEQERRALQDDPSLVQAHSGLAFVYINQGRKDLAPGEVEQVLKAHPEDLQAQMMLALYHHLNGDYAAARPLYTRILEADPLFTPAREFLGEILRQQGDTAGAIREQEKTLEQAPGDILAARNLARTYLNTGDLARARQGLERARSRDPQNYALRTAWALLLALEGKRKEALKEMDEEVQKYAAAHVFDTSELAEAYAALGEESKALDWLDRAVRNGDERAEWFRRDPLLANIRDHPRFKQILESIEFRRQQRAKPAGAK